jgi:tetratricopeptide (TPR) repeat protein
LIAESPYSQAIKIVQSQTNDSILKSLVKEVSEFSSGSPSDVLDRKLTNYLTKNPKNPYANILYGVYLNKINQSKKGLPFFLKADRFLPESPFIKIVLGEYYNSQADLRNAFASYLQAIEIDPSNSELHFQLSLFLSTNSKKIQKEGMLSPFSF